MDAWQGWEAGRVVVLFAALMYLGIWVQMSLFHWAGAFRRWEMWVPVALTPIIVAAAILGGIQREGILGWVALAGLALGAMEGMGGLWFHFQGIAAHVGGVNVRNSMAGPPPVLPMAYSLVGVLGLIGILWDA